MTKVIYVNHKVQQCGVYEFGKEIGLLLEKSKLFQVSYIECDSYAELAGYYNKIKPDIIVYNYHPSTMSWIESSSKYYAHKTFHLQAVHIGMIHEVYQQKADSASNDLFDFHIAPDPTLLLKNPLVYKTGRLLPQKAEEVEVGNPIPVVGSFGFATPNKGFENIIKLVQSEFDEAIINLNLPIATNGDADGQQAKKIANNCRQLVNKEKITLNIDHTYLNKNDLLAFLSKNTINVFLYDEVRNRGISSATDWGLASGRPLAISKSGLFRHLLKCDPSICVSDNKLRTIIENGVRPLRGFYEEYTEEIVLWDYERIFASILTESTKKDFVAKSIYQYYRNAVRTKLSRQSNEVKNSVWVHDNDDYEYAGIGNEAPVNYHPVGAIILNRILDDSARKLYEPTIDFLTEHLPDLILKKIPEANVQQAFVFDTAVRLAQHFNGPRILAVGAFEDTAAEGLKLLGYNIDFIDPVLNYDIETYISKPNVKKGMYDLVISTSVIEHVEKDEKFVQDIVYLLSDGGYAIITCDFKDQYKKGDDIPAVDFRFYTQYDLKVRLLEAIPNCKLVDQPDWNCPNPDFYYLGTYNYTFASLVFRKSK